MKGAELTEVQSDGSVEEKLLPGGLNHRQQKK